MILFSFSRLISDVWWSLILVVGDGIFHKDTNETFMIVAYY